MFILGKGGKSQKVSIDYLNTAHLDIEQQVEDTNKCLSFENQQGHIAVILRVANNLACLLCLLLYMKHYENN